MNELLSGLQSQEGVEGEKDSLGGGGLLDSGIYLLTIKNAFLTVSKGGAIGLVLQTETDTGRRFDNTEWMTSGTAKGRKNTYTRDGKEHYLAGFNNANAICLLTVGKEISAMVTEKKVVKLFKEGKEEPTEVDMLTELQGKQFYAGILRQTVNKNEQNDAGDYVPTAETRDENVVDKIFRLRDKKTVHEIRTQVETAEFFDGWDKKNTGVTRDKVKKVEGATAGAPGAAKKGGDTPQLFA